MLGDVDALIYNVGSGRFKGYDEITAETLELNFKENALGLLLTSQQVKRFFFCLGGQAGRQARL